MHDYDKIEIDQASLPEKSGRLFYISEIESMESNICE
jgi:hypothetical protein